MTRRCADGSQGEESVFRSRQTEIAQRLAEIGIDYIEGGYPLSNEKGRSVLSASEVPQAWINACFGIRYDPSSFDESL